MTDSEPNPTEEKSTVKEDKEVKSDIKGTIGYIVGAVVVFILFYLWKTS